MMKHLWASYRAVLLKILNHSWMKGIIPAVWKEALIIPVPKKGKDKNPHSYCTISLQSCTGKLLERMVNRWLPKLQLKQHTGSSEALRTNLPSLPRTSRMHSRGKRRFWLSSLIFQMHLSRPGKRVSLSNFWGVSASKDVHLDPALPVCKNCGGEACWQPQQKSLPSWRNTEGQCSVSHTVLGLH